VGANVSIGLTGDPSVFVETDQYGRYEFSKDNIPNSPLTVTLTCDALGFQHFEETFEVEIGNIYVKNVQMSQGMLKVA